MEVKRPKLGCNVYFRVMLAVNCSAASVVVNSLWVVWPLASWWQQTGTHYLYCHYFKCWTRYRGERGPYAPNWAPRSRIGQMEKNSLEGQRGDFSGVETPSAECLSTTLHHLSRPSLWEDVAVHFGWRHSHLTGLIPPAPLLTFCSL